MRAIEAKIVCSLKPNTSTMNLRIHGGVFTSSRTASIKLGDIASDT